MYSVLRSFERLVALMQIAASGASGNFALSIAILGR